MEKRLRPEENYAQNMKYLEEERYRWLSGLGQKNIHVFPSLALEMRSLAAQGFLVNGDVALCRSRIVEAVELMVTACDGYDRGLKVDASFVTMTDFYWGLDAMAVGNLDLSRKFFKIIGGRVKEEKANDSKFISALGYACKELVTQGKCSSERMKAVREQLSKPSFIGYANMIEGVSSRDSDLVDRGVQEVLKGHKSLARVGGIFSCTPDEYICFWAIGLLNLAKEEGLMVNIPDNTLLPKAFLK